jgi:hypothetical protein
MGQDQRDGLPRFNIVAYRYKGSQPVLYQHVQQQNRDQDHEHHECCELDERHDVTNTLPVVLADIVQSFIVTRSLRDCKLGVTSVASPLPTLVESHPPPGLHRSSLYRSVGVLEPEPQCGVVRVLEVGVRLSLEGGDLVGDVGQLAGYVLGDVGGVPGPGVWVFALAHPLRILQAVDP